MNIDDEDPNKEILELLDRVRNSLTEHCCKVHIIVETLSDDPLMSGSVLFAKYGTHTDVLGLLAYSTLKEQYMLKKEFDAS